MCFGRCCSCGLRISLVMWFLKFGFIFSSVWLMCVL